MTSANSSITPNYVPTDSASHFPDIFFNFIVRVKRDLKYLTIVHDSLSVTLFSFVSGVCSTLYLFRHKVDLTSSRLY